MYKYFIKDRRSHLLLVADIMLLIGIAFYDWDPERVMLFFGLDISLCILSFVVYNVILMGSSTLSSAITGSLVVVVPLIGILYLLISPPYFDLSIFMTFAVLSHVFDVKKYLGYNSSVARPGFALYVGLLFFMGPLLFVLISVFEFLDFPKKLSLALSLVIVRQFTEYKRYQKFLQIEKEINA